MIEATPAEQRQLLQLQRIDTAIHKLEHRRAHLPEQQALDDNAEILGRVALEHTTNRDTLRRLTAQQRRYEDEIATVDARRKSEEGRMYSRMITSERELTALRGEIASLKARKNDQEDALLEVMEQREEIETLVEELRARHGELTDAVAGLSDARDAAATDIDAELAGCREQRKMLAAQLRPDLLTAYDDRRKRGQGLGVAELRGRTCQGCRLELTAIELEEARAASRHALATCQQCGRYLVPA